MAYRQGSERERWGSAVLTALAVAAIGYALIGGLAVSVAVRPADVITLFQVAAPPPPPPPERPPPQQPRKAEREGASAPPNLKSKATEVAAPKPVVPPLRPPPIVVAPVPSVGVESMSGAAPVAGPGTGAGGVGTGTGSGGEGDGPGDGGTPARLVSDTLRIRDLPPPVVRASLSDGQHYIVYLRFTVGVTGKVTECTVTRSSGDPSLDAATCEATMRRLRYRPELDRAGRPVPIAIVGTQEWSAINGLSPSGRSDESY